jgi:hypothetical protein
VRLGQRLMLVPGSYTLKMGLNGAESETKFELKAPEARKARAKEKPKMRGKDGYEAAPEPEPAARERELD